MALFLSESLSTQNTYKGNYIDLLIEQSEIQSELNTLNEAIYQADFIIHEQSRTLSESAAQVLQENFLANAWEKIKAFVRKAITWIKEFAKKIKDKVVELYNRIKDRIKGDTVEVAKSKIADMEDAVKFIEQNAKLMEKLSGQTNTTITDSIKEQGAKLKADFDKKKEANAKMTGSQKVSFTYYEKIVKASQMNEQVSEKVARDFEGEIKALEAKHKAELADSQESLKIAQANAYRNHKESERNAADAESARNDAASARRDANAANSDLQAKNSELQTQINGVKVGAAIAMELARAAGAAAAAAAAVPVAAPANDTVKPEEKAEAASDSGVPTGIPGATREKPGMNTRTKPSMNTRAKPSMNTRAKPNMNTR